MLSKRNDVEVICVSCKKSVGYVVKYGHSLWVCPTCNGGKWRAVDVEAVPDTQDGDQ